MKKQFTICAVLLFILFLIFGCSAAEKGINSTAAPQPKTDTWATEQGIRQLMDTITGKMTAEEKIGQMMYYRNDYYGKYKKHTIRNACGRRHLI